MANWWDPSGQAMPLIKVGQRYVMPLGDGRPPASAPTGGPPPGIPGDQWMLWQAVRADYVSRHGVADPPNWNPE